MTPSETRSAVRLSVIVGVVALALLALLTVLPHDPYIRWKAVRSEAYARLGWLYERVHYDRTPIDIGFIGTSHSLNGIDAALVQRRIAESGVRAADGRCLTATNFAIPSYGRNLHWLAAREVLENRPVKLLVIEVFENETRKAHPLFSHVAPVRDVLGAPLVVNLNYAADIVRLPYRQLSLWAQTLAPEQFGLSRTWDPADYDGSTVDNTRVVNVGGQALTPSRDKTAPIKVLEAQAAKNAAKKNLNMLGKRFEAIEYAYPLHYLNSLLDLARAKNVKVVFLYLPGYAQPARPYDMRPYEGRGDMLFANDVLVPKDRWYDADHLNTAGAAVYSARIADQLGAEVGAKTGLTAEGCDFGYPARTTLKPFVKP